MSEAISGISLFKNSPGFRFAHPGYWVLCYGVQCLWGGDLSGHVISLAFCFRLRASDRDHPQRALVDTIRITLALFNGLYDLLRDRFMNDAWLCEAA